jgi:hypothetical protein
MNSLVKNTASVGDVANETQPASRRAVELLATALAKLGLLRHDADYHVLRAAMVLIFFSSGTRNGSLMRSSG